MDIGSAFTFVFDDEDWIKKVAIGGGIILLGIILLPLLLLGLLLFLPLNGYMLEVLKNVRDGQAKPLPEWSDFGGQTVGCRRIRDRADSRGQRDRCHPGHESCQKTSGDGQGSGHCGRYGKRGEHESS